MFFDKTIENNSTKEQSGNDWWINSREQRPSELLEPKYPSVYIATAISQFSREKEADRAALSAVLVRIVSQCSSTSRHQSTCRNFILGILIDYCVQHGCVQNSQMVQVSRYYLLYKLKMQKESVSINCWRKKCTRTL